MCKAPARSPSFSGVLANKGQNTLEISANAFDYTTTGLLINYLPSADDANSGRQISALEALGLIYGYTLITEVLVTNGPVTGGTPAVIDGANFDSQDVSCKFMSTQTSAIWVNSFRIICMTPPQPAGFAALELLDGSETTNFGNQFHFHPRVKVSLLEPTFASTRGGELVMVNGKHFMQFAELGEMPYKVGTFCSLGTLAVEPAHFISSALVICETLEHQKADLRWRFHSTPWTSHFPGFSSIYAITRRLMPSSLTAHLRWEERSSPYRVAPSTGMYRRHSVRLHDVVVLASRGGLR